MLFMSFWLFDKIAVPYRNKDSENSDLTHVFLPYLYKSGFGRKYEKWEVILVLFTLKT